MANLPDRIRAVISDSLTLARKEGLTPAWRNVARKLWHVSHDVFYERVARGHAAALEPSVTIVSVPREDAGRYSADLARAGAGTDIRYFAKGATCYLAYLDGKPVGLGWRFKDSYLLRRLRYPRDAVYVGGFHVVPEVRGRGIYPALLNRICSDIANPAARVVAHAAPDNAASQRGLTKAGFARTGELFAVILGGLIVYWRWR